jgi:hypothetical protein
MDFVGQAVQCTKKVGVGGKREIGLNPQEQAEPCITLTPASRAMVST